MTRHGITVRDTAMMLGVPEGTVRRWLHRGKIHRTHDGKLDPESVRKWWDVERDPKLSKREPIHRSKRNPYQHPDAPSHQGCS